MNVNPPATPDANLEQLLNRSDIWRGDSYRPAPQRAQDSGYVDINAALINKGWPTSSLIEVYQKGLQLQEWLLFLPALAAATGYIVLLNPPGTPFCQAFIQAGIDLERIVVVHSANKADFLASFAELARTQACEVLFAWQQHQALSYTELRKCLLATNEGAGLCVLFRPESAQQQSSPAVLRLLTQMTSRHIQLTIFKQKGVLQPQSHPINLPLSTALKGLLPHSLLDQTVLSGKSGTTPSKQKSAAIMPLRRGKK
jgi:protein ImuA